MGLALRYFRETFDFLFPCTNLLLTILIFAFLLRNNCSQMALTFSHRIPTSQKYQGKRSAPAIVVKFARRDTKEMFYRGRKELRGLTTQDLGFSDENNIFINESLTEANKELFKATLKVKKDYSYNYIWTSNGKIYLRKDRDSSAILIKNEGELDKLKR